jgi:lipooligosaccharide transport system ATP-binding protein
MEYLMKAEGVTKAFGDFVAVNDVSFHVRPQECFGILGPNGAGKTSIIRMTYGFSPLTQGSLTVFGLSIVKDWRKIKSRIGVCQQENNLDPDLTVQENLAVFARYFNLPKKEAHKQAEKLLAFMALEHRRNDKVTKLSGGMMRRLVLARSLVNDPDLLILDEPTTGLDPQSRHQVWEKLDELKSQGITILITTHYMDEASRLCDRLVIMDHGEILVEGAPSDLIRKHVGQEVIEVGVPSRELRTYLGSQDMTYEDLGHRLIVYGDKGDELFHKITDDYCEESCVLRMASLEDVFLKLTGRGLRE